MTWSTTFYVGLLILWSTRPAHAPRHRANPILRRGRRRRAPRPIGWLAGGIVGATALFPPLGLAAGLVVLVRLRGRARRAAGARLRSVERTLGDVVELLAAVVDAGVPLRRAIATIAPRAPDPHRTAWLAAVARIERGQPLETALDRLADDLGEPVRPLVAALLSADRDGVALGPALERCRAEAQRRRRVRAEEQARRIPVLMLFPLVCCVLPAFVFMTVVPLVAGSLADLDVASIASPPSHERGAISDP